MSPLLLLVLGLLALDGALRAAVDWIHLRRPRGGVPPELEGWTDAARLDTMRRRQRDESRLELISRAITLPVLLVFLAAGGLGWADRLARAAGSGLIGTGLLFGGLLVGLSELLHLPFALYETFGLEARYGFNRTTPRTFVLDWLKQLMLTALLGGAALAGVLGFLAWAGRWGWLWAWGALAVFELFVLWISPTVLLPWFNKFTPLPDGALRAALEDYARGQGWRLRGVFTLDGSRRSSRANAYVTGFGRTRRIALYDTLLARHPVEETVAILAHETGHWKRGHVVRGLAVSLTVSLVLFSLLPAVLHRAGWYAAFGISPAPLDDRLPLYAGLVLFGLLCTPLSFLLGLGSHALSRRWEFEADAFAARTTGHPEWLVAALRRLAADQLDDPDPHPWKVRLDYSHPPTAARIRRLETRWGRV